MTVVTDDTRRRAGAPAGSFASWAGGAAATPTVVLAGDPAAVRA